MPLPRAALRRLAALALAGTALVAGCGDDPAGDAAAPGAVEVLASTTIVGDLARAVGGDAVDVHQLLTPASDPHDYEPRPDDVLAATDAAVVLASGRGLDGWIGEVAEQAGDVPVVELGARVPIVREDGGETDPHWWHDPRNVEAAIETVRASLAEAHPDRRETFARNAAAYARRVRALDAAIRTCVNAVPPGARKLVTDHDAFGYFADRYGIEVVGTVIPSLTTQAQPSAGELAELSRTIEREGVATVFSEESVNAKLAEAIARETGVRSDDSLYGDTLGPAGSVGATWLAMEAHNADAIVRGLTGGRRGCPAP